MQFNCPPPRALPMSVCLPDSQPNVSATNPGKRIDFVAHRVARQHPDQFAPYMLFGCDMEAVFDATLFRFPLRTEDLAARSRISKQVLRLPSGASTHAGWTGHS
jgi:hypothetical protein